MNFRRVALAAVAALLSISSVFAQGSPDLVISQVYGGGGNSGATYLNDYVEIFNRGAAPVSLSGKSLQYASSTGTGSLGVTNQITVLPNVSINSGQYFLVQEASGGANGAALTPDFTPASGAINMAAGAGKIALVNSTTSLGCNGAGTNLCSAAQKALIIDLVGFGTGTNFFEGAGPTPTISAVLAAFRAGGGCADTDNNAADFTAALPAPRNSSTAIHTCGTSSPAGSGAASPNLVQPGGSTLLTVTVTPGANPTSTGISVTADLSSIGGAAAQLFANPSGNTFTFTATVSATTTDGAKTFPVTITDAQGRTGSASIALTIATSTPPTAHGSANPTSVDNGSTTLLTVSVTPGSNPVSTAIAVTGNLASIGGSSAQQFFDNGTNGDVTAGDNIFSFIANVPTGTPGGAKSIAISVVDAQSRTASTSIALTTNAPVALSATGSANPASVARGDSTQLTVTVTPATIPASSGITVTGDLSAIGGSSTQSFAPNGNVFTFSAAVPFLNALGAKTLPISVTDAQGRSASTNISVTVTVPALPAGTIVISQIYGGGGNAGSTLHNDFIELFNRSNNPVSVDGWSVQHFSSSNPTWFETPLSGVIQPHSYYLVQEAAGTTAGGGTVPLPTPDAMGNIGLSSTAGTVALSTSTDLPADQTICSMTSGVIDFVGYGAGSACSGKVAIGPGFSNTTGALRALGGCKYTNSATDFVIGPPAPRNSATPSNDCGTATDTIPPHVMISQLYGGGGNSNAAYNNDFIELYNPTDADVSLEGWSIQYASSTGNGWASNAQPLGGSIPTHGYFLIELASGGTDSPQLPPPRIIGNINMSGSTGKVALVSSFTPLTGNCPIGNPTLVDFIGYGAADCFEGGLAAPSITSNMQSLIRSTNSDTNQNSVDFSRLTPPNPRGTGVLVELPPIISSFGPVTPAPFDASIEVDFSEPVNVADGWYSISCGTTGSHNDVAIASAFNAETWIITPNQSFAPGETCTVHVFKQFVTDVDTNDDGPNTDNLPNDFQWTFTVANDPAVADTDSHLTMGNPTNAIDSMATPNNFLMEKPEYVLSYNRDKGTPNWVSWHLIDAWTATGSRTDSFRPNPAVPPTWYRVLNTDYSGSGFDRGHMCPSADRNVSVTVNQATFLMTNMVPQSPNNNQGPWEKFEAYLRTLVPCVAPTDPCDEVYIVSGPYGNAGTLANGHITIPEGTWKVALVLPKQSGNDVQRVTAATTTIAIKISNIDPTVLKTDDWTATDTSGNPKYITTVRAIENLSGYDFFSNVSKIVQNSIEAGTNGKNPPGVANETVNTNEDQSANVTIDAVSPDAHPVYTYTIDTNPAHGTLSGSGPNYTYTPAPDYNGNDTFTFHVNDGHFNSNTATVAIHITPVNDAPVLTGVPATADVNELTAYSFNAHASDVDADPLSFSLVGAPAGAAIDASGHFTWTPTEAQGPSSYSFTVRVSDGTVNTDIAITIAVKEVNALPVLGSVSTQTAILGSTLTFTATATDSDIPAQTLAYSLAGAPAGAAIDPSTGVFTWTPTGDQAGITFNFNVTVSDGVATASTPVVAIVVDNGAPVISTLVASLTQLWPPNHQMVDITITYSVIDAGDPAPSCTLHVTSNEPIDGTGDGDMAPDWLITDAHHVKLRAERAGSGTGRVYTIGADCADRFGNLAHSANVTVSVPKSQNGK